MDGTGGFEASMDAVRERTEAHDDGFQRAASVEAALRAAAPRGPSRAPRSGRRTRRLVAAVVAVAVLAGAAAFVVTRSDGGPSYPDEWATEVLPHVEIVEDLRELDFERPVFVDFLPEEQFRAEVTADAGELTEEDRQAFEQATGLLRALGLVEGEVDLFGASNDLSGETTLGFYSHETKRITMRGTELTPAVRSTLVHELTHALQDQHFAMGERFDVLEAAGDDAASAAWRAVIEGDANRIERAYRDGLGEEDRAALDEEQQAGVEEFETDTADVPEVLVTMQSAPYALGEALLALVEEAHGSFAIDGVFQDPPLSDEHLLDPWTLLADDLPAATTEPKLAEGDEELDRGSFGALGWLLVLAERLPLTQALDATDGWGGDAYVAFERDGSSCARMSYRGDTASDTEQMHAALEAWVAADEGGKASVEQLGAELRFESCDPGAGADTGRGASEEALGIMLNRTYLTIEVLRQGADERQARCFGDGLVRAFSLDELSRPDALDDPVSQQRIAELAHGCR